MLNKPFTVCSFATISILSVFTPAISAASEIVLTLKNQDVTIAGDFAGFRQKAYIVSTATGKLYVPAVHVDCEGQDCLVFLATNDQNN